MEQEIANLGMPTLEGRAVRAQLLSALARLGIAHQTIDHPAFFTVEDGQDFKKDIAGGHSKNLFLKDKNGALTLVVAHCDSRVDLVALGKGLGARGRLSFGKPDLMEEVLGVTPGSVTPFTLINKSAGALTHLVIDDALMAFETVWFHPLENTASTGITPQDLLKFARACGFGPMVVNVSAPPLKIAP